VELVTLQRQPSLIAESFRAVLTSILFSGENGDRPRVLVFTSAGPSEGKTTVVSNLAIALAEIHRRVLVIDGDLRKPRMHEIFDLPNERGLSDLLAQRSLDEDAVKGVLQQTRVPDLFVLPSGPPTAAAANLLHSPHLPSLLKTWRSEFDSILLDTPPMLQMPDARVLGRLADGVVLVLRAGRTTREMAQAAKQRFADDSTRVVGSILNNWDPKSSRDGHYGYYKGYYRHYQSGGYPG
jgi:receptor protein-tyrosine kinase